MLQGNDLKMFEDDSDAEEVFKTATWPQGAEEASEQPSTEPQAVDEQKFVPDSQEPDSLVPEIGSMVEVEESQYGWELPGLEEFNAAYKADDEAKVGEWVEQHAVSRYVVAGLK